MDIPVLLTIDNLGFNPNPEFRMIWRFCQLPIPPFIGMTFAGTATVPEGQVIDDYAAGAQLSYVLIVSAVQWELNTHLLEVGCDYADDGDVSLDAGVESVLALLAADGWQFGLAEWQKHLNPPA